jgi:hypothetical protein
MEEQCVGAQPVPSGAASVASGKGNLGMGSRIPVEIRASPAGIPTNEGDRIPQGSRSRTRGIGNAACKFQLCTKAIVGTHAASRSYNLGLQ